MYIGRWGKGMGENEERRREEWRIRKVGDINGDYLDWNSQKLGILFEQTAKIPFKARVNLLTYLRTSVPFSLL